MHVLLCTIPPDQATAFLTTLLEARLVACGNQIEVRSLYRWKGKVEDEPEVLLVMETARGDLQATIQAIAAHHPYEVPKIIALAPADVLPAYLAWAREETTP